MNAMKFRAMALVAVFTALAVVGCNKDEAKNGSAPTGTSNQPTPDATANANNAPVTTEANNAPVTAEANNAPAPAAANNTPPLTADQAKDEAAKKQAEAARKKLNQLNIGEPAVAGQGGWKKVTSDPKVLTQAVEAKMKSLKNYKMSIAMVVEMPLGKGIVNADCLIADQSRYRLEYSDFEPGATAHFESSLVARMSDKTYSTFVNGAYKKGRIAPNPDVLKGWVLDSTHYLASWIGTDKKPLTELVGAAQKAKWKVGVEEKKFEKGTYQRIVMESSTGPKKRYELLIDPKQMLPTTFNVAVYDKKKTLAGLDIAWLQSDKPLTDADLSQKVSTEPVKVITEEQAAKMKGLKKIG